MTMTIDGSNGFSLDGQFNSASSFGFKNRIINGAMMIDQRNVGASVTPTDSSYTLDRWKSYASQASKYSVQQNAGNVTPPAGYKNYLGVTSLSSYAITSTDYFSISQIIEGYNVADFNFGSANASTITVSFWVRSSLTGLFGGCLLNAYANRWYPFSYTINAANTWEQKTITIAGDTTGTWATNNLSGLEIRFCLGVGSTYSGTAGVWTSTVTNSVTGATSVVGTNGATFYITGVQLEKGSTATSFDYIPYGTELALCQRYFEVGVNLIQGYGNGSNGVFGNAPFKVTKRAAPTVTNQGLSYAGLTVADFTINAANPSYADNYSTVNSAILAANYTSAPAVGMCRYQGIFTASAEL